MAKHNKWSKVKHRKAAVEKKRGRIWTKIAKAIIVAAKNGGGDPAVNLSLRYAMDEARYANMPRDTIERAVKKGAGGEDTSNYESVRYECYAPGGVAVIVDALTDNRTRTITLVRDALTKHDGSVGSTGCVGYMFRHLGRIEIAAAGTTEDAVMQAAIDAGAHDVRPPQDPEDDDATWTVLTEATALQGAKLAIEKAGFRIVEALFDMIPESTVAVRGDAAKALVDLVDVLEDIDDVQKVYTNADIELDDE